MMSTVIVKKSMKPMQIFRMRLNPNLRGLYLIMYQIQVSILPPTKLVIHCLRTSDDDDEHDRNFFASRVTKLHLGGIETLEVRIPKSSISSASILKEV